jgi:hypothetical protein
MDTHIKSLGDLGFVAAEANALGYGGVTRISKITGIARSTIKRGQDEIAQENALGSNRLRRLGGGRKKSIYHYPRWPEVLEQLIDPLSRGDPESPLRWSIKSTKTLSDELKRQGYSKLYIGSSFISQVV